MSLRQVIKYSLKPGDVFKPGMKKSVYTVVSVQSGRYGSEILVRYRKSKPVPIENVRWDENLREIGVVYKYEEPMPRSFPPEDDNDELSAALSIWMGKSS